MSTATTTTAENAGLPAMLDTKDVAEMFKRCNLAVYAEARRIYYREVNLNPCKSIRSRYRSDRMVVLGLVCL